MLFYVVDDTDCDDGDDDDDYGGGIFIVDELWLARQSTLACW